jgi:hypothetical protein
MVLGLENRPGASVTSFKAFLERGEKDDCDVEEEPI